MQSNWSLVLNVLLLIGVFVALGRMMKARRQNLNSVNHKPSIGKSSDSTHFDDIIAVRKINGELETTKQVIKPTIRPSSQAVNLFKASQPLGGLQDQIIIQNPLSSTLRTESPRSQGEGNTDKGSYSEKKDEPISSLMMFLLAKENRQLAGYELLQTVLAAGLRFGEGHLFHRHQSPNGQGPVLCSLAAATASGIFDMQNIGAFSVHGLCLFMQASGNPTIDAERFAIMLDTEKQLSDGLDTYLLDDKRQPLSDESIQHYYRLLNLADVCEQSALA